ncbi:MAG: multiheme c-type cytochrome [Planctomycetota bacterium]|nr:multiheme c-type cytochrome [Planctomycetota bacterium]
MTTILLRRPAVLLLAALIISFGCGPNGGPSGEHNGENHDKAAPTAASDQPPPAADEKPRATMAAADKSLARSEEPRRLKTLVLPPTGEKSALLKKLASDEKQTATPAAEKNAPGTLHELPGEQQPPMAIPPKDDKRLKRASSQTAPNQATAPASLLTNSAAKNLRGDLPGKTAAPRNSSRTNPLRNNQPSSWLQNPMREDRAKLPANVKANGPFQAQPVVGTTLPAGASEEKPAPRQALPAQPLAGQPMGGLTNTSRQTPVAEMRSVGKSKKDAASKFDPVKKNGTIFVGWKKPKLAIVITGREDGYIEPCGCAGLESMKGGLSRRHTMIEQLLARGWPLLRVDVGGLSKGYGVQAELKFQITVDAMKKMGYHAIGFSPNDLQLPVDSLVAVADNSETNPSPFISANVGLLGFDAEITAPWRVVEVGGIKVGVTSVLGKQYQKKLAGGDIEFADPEDAIKRVLPEMKKHCRLMILLAHATWEESIALSKEFDDFAVVVTSGGPPAPPAKPTVIDGSKALLIEVGEKGMDAIVLGIYLDRDQPYRYQRVPLDSRFAASKDMKNSMKAYQEQLKKLGLAGLAIKPVKHPDRELNGEFVGSKACQNCHEPSYDVWKKSGHAKAWSTLLHTDPPRNHDPECISCHVIGWHPTKHFPSKSGFLSEKLTPKMLDVGCESCHGPGGAHVKAEMGNDEALQLRMQKAVRITKEEAKNNYEKGCLSCHDLDNSPDFNFETYWPKVEHKENE